MHDLMIKEKLRTWRESNDLSRELFARMCGITQMTEFRAETCGKINLLNYIKILDAIKRYEDSKTNIN